MRARDVPCPDCGAQAGADCVAFGLRFRPARPMLGVHPRRAQAAAYAAQAKELDPCD